MTTVKLWESDFWSRSLTKCKSGLSLGSLYSLKPITFYCIWPVSCVRSFAHNNQRSEPGTMSIPFTSKETQILRGWLDYAHEAMSEPVQTFFFSEQTFCLLSFVQLYTVLFRLKIVCLKIQEKDRMICTKTSSWRLAAVRRKMPQGNLAGFPGACQPFSSVHGIQS